MLSTDKTFCSLNFTGESRYNKIKFYDKSKNYNHERSASWTSPGISFLTNEQNHSLKERRKATVDSQQGNQIRPTHYLNVLI